MSSSRNATHYEWAWNDIIDLLKPVTACDGHPRGDADIRLWLGVANAGRWWPAEAVAAVEAVCIGFTGFRIMPGHVTELLRAERRQPHTDRTAIGAAHPVPPHEVHARVVEITSRLAAKRDLNRAIAEPDPETERADQRARLDAIWAAVDACRWCDDRGMVGELVCTHPVHIGELDPADAAAIEAAQS